MLTERLKDKIIFTPDINGEYIKVIAKSDKDFVVLDSKFIKEEYTLKLTYIGEYFIYISDDGTFTEEPNEIFFYYDCLLEKVVEDYLSIACPCDDCNKDSPCSEKEVNKLLCLYDKVISLNYLLPQENVTILNNLTKIYKDLLNKDILEGMTQSVYEGQSKCCSDLSLKNLGVNILGLYYAYRKLLPNLLNDIDEIFQIQDLKECLKDSGLCLKEIINYFEEEYGPIINPPYFKGFEFVATIKNSGSLKHRFDFKYSHFESQYTDPQNLPSKNISIVQLPDVGDLYYQNTKITSTPFLVPKDFIDGDLYFEGMLPANLAKYPIDFYAKMSNDADIYSNSAKIGGKVGVVFNAPPVVGNNSVDIVTGTTYTFTSEDFTVNTTPPYNDPEGDNPKTIKIETLPRDGRLVKLVEGNRSDVFVGDIITIDDVSNGYLRYETPTTDLNNRRHFTFRINDYGSNLYSNVGTFNLNVSESYFTTNKDYFDINRDESTVINITDNDIINVNNYNIIIISEPTAGSLIINSGIVTYVPNPNSTSKSDIFYYKLEKNGIESNVSPVTLGIKDRDFFYFGDSNSIINNEEDVKSLLNRDTIDIDKLYTYTNTERNNTIVIPLGYTLDYIITSNQEYLTESFYNEIISIKEGLDVKQFTIYRHSSVLPLEVDINFKIKK